MCFPQFTETRGYNWNAGRLGSKDSIVRVTRNFYAAGLDPFPAVVGFESLAVWPRCRRHPDGSACQQGGFREGQGFPGSPSQNPSGPMWHTLAVLAAFESFGARPHAGPDLEIRGKRERFAA